MRHSSRAAACATTSSTPRARSTSSSSRPRPGGSPIRRAWQPDAVALLRRCHRGLRAAADRRSRRIMKLVDAMPGYAAAFRTGVQRHAAAKDQRIVSSLSAIGRGALPRVPEGLSVDCAPRPAIDAGVVPRHDARDRQPHPQEPVAQVIRPRSWAAGSFAPRASTGGTSAASNGVKA